MVINIEMFGDSSQDQVEIRERKTISKVKTLSKGVFLTKTFCTKAYKALEYRTCLVSNNRPKIVNGTSDFGNVYTGTVYLRGTIVVVIVW